MTPRPEIDAFPPMAGCPACDPALMSLPEG